MLALASSLLFMAWLCISRPVVAVAMCFLLFSLGWRLVAAGYLELAGPVYAEELLREVGGAGAGTAFGIAVLATLLVFEMMFRSAGKRLRPRRIAVPAGSITLGDLAFFTGGLFVVLLYADMLRRGVVPLFQNMERYDYASQLAGPLHGWLFEYGQLLMLQFGTFLVFPRLQGSTPDLRFLALAVAVMGYCLLTGHRFSAFYSFGSFFLMPLSAPILLSGRGRLPPAARFNNALTRWLIQPRAWVILGVGAALFVVGALANSFVNVRSYGADVGDKLYQRVLVQPIQLWWLSWERVAVNGDWNSSAAAEFMFENAIDSTRNTGIQFLMVRAIGHDRASELLANGQQYAGGFPEVLFELFGPVWAWGALILVALVTAWTLRVWLRALICGRFATAFCAMYVFYAFSIFYIGGMANFLVAWTFWVKVGALVVCYFVESSVQRAGFALVPWVLWRSRLLCNGK